MENREGKRYRVVNNEGLEHYNIKVGDECVMYEDDGSDRPLFYSEHWTGVGIFFIYMNKLELIEERPERYASREVNGMDVIDLINHWNLNFCEGNILKYLLRDKGEDESDIEKIIDYAQRELKRRRDCK